MFFFRSLVGGFYKQLYMFYTNSKSSHTYIYIYMYMYMYAPSVCVDRDIGTQIYGV